MPKDKEIIEKDKEEVKEKATEKTTDKIKKENKENKDKQVKNTTNKIKKNDKETNKTKEKKEEKKTKKELIVKKNNEEFDKQKLEKIEEEIKKQTTISEEKKKKINKKLFKNIIIAIVIVLYFTFINLGFYNLEPSKFLVDLQVFSILSIGITIIIFEVAYKKDSGELAIYGIEALVLSICTLLTIYVGMYYRNKFSYIINTVSMLFAIYYVAKSIIIYTKMKKKALKRASDIDKIRRAK